MGETGPAAAAEALINWWALAGVDSAVAEAPVNWLRPAPIAAPPPPAAPVARPTEGYPGTLDAFHAWLRDAPSLPDAAWVGPRVLPRGSHGAALMVVCDVPDQQDLAAQALLSGEAGELFDAMMAAIGQTRESLYIASLAVTRPAGGILDDVAAATLAGRMRHHVGLVAPRRLLLLGDKSAKALLPSADSGRRSHLRSFNHDGGTVPAIATFHPRLLLRQPAAKAESWRALQHLIEVQPW